MDQWKKLQEMTHDIPIAMLTTRDENGRLRSRPMAIQQSEWDGTLWFFTAVDSPKVDEIHLSHDVAVAFSEPKDQKYISISGSAFVVQDMGKAKELWSPLMKSWFPKGLDDPRLALLKVTIHEAEFWDAPNGTMVQLVGMAKAALTGKPYEASEAEHSKVFAKS